MKEKDLYQKFLKDLKNISREYPDERFWYYKIPDTGQHKKPFDSIFNKKSSISLKLFSYAIEFKMDGEYPTPLQFEELRNFSLAGGISCVYYSYQSMTDFLHFLLGHANASKFKKWISKETTYQQFIELEKQQRKGHYEKISAGGVNQ